VVHNTEEHIFTEPCRGEERKRRKKEEREKRKGRRRYKQAELLVKCN
jgi:hypothetical protein